MSPGPAAYKILTSFDRQLKTKNLRRALFRQINSALSTTTTHDESSNQNTKSKRPRKNRSKSNMKANNENDYDV